MKSVGLLYNELGTIKIAPPLGIGFTQVINSVGSF
jgi:hypothetical protein